MSKVWVNGTITKVSENDDGSLYVEGVASSEARDEDPKAVRKWGKGEIITAEAVKAAIPDYMKWGAVREMHQPIAAGTAVSIEVREDDKTYFAANIVDEGSVKKVKNSVLKGFSLGGSALSRDPNDPSIVTGLKLTEVSLVDRPSNPDCRMELIKLDSGEDEMLKKAKPVVDAKSAEPAKGEPAKVEKCEAVPKTTETPEAPKPPPRDEIKKFAGSEVWDCKMALDALGLLSSLVAMERSEDHAEAASQVADLQAAIARIKAFVASEIQETATTSETTIEVPAKTEPVAAAADAGDIQKAGSRFSSETKKALAEHYSKLEECAKALKKCHGDFAKLGWKDEEKDPEAAKEEDTKKEESAKAALIGDIEKRATLAEDAAGKAGEALAKIMSERDGLAKKYAEAVVELGRKGVTRAVAIEKSADTGAPVKEDEESKTALDGIKKVLATGGTPYRIA